ncbi:MAG: hypothetical protein LBN06_09850 [Prevotellaceae bacterium]|jgi:hypothetical protein|nr:hypothetical protein [Prevotellaceae bacterium]
MKKLILLFLLACGSYTLMPAADGSNQHLSPEEFRLKQKAVIIETAQLTPQEANAFFPVYFELQDRKQEINDKMWKEMRRVRGNNMSEAEYAKMVETINSTRVDLAQLENDYLAKFRRILSNKKIFMVQRAELRFNREILKGMHRGGPPPGRPKGNTSNVR